MTQSRHKIHSTKTITMKPNFGTYHHTTEQMSEKIREWAKISFSEAFEQLSFSRDSDLKIVDIGCGLGFLCCLCAEYYPNSIVTGFDTFEDASLKNSSLNKAKTNARILGLSERIRFHKKDFFRSNFSRSKVDLFVSNLVFHNFGKSRLDAYGRLARWSAPKSRIVLGDLFFDYKTDLAWLRKFFGGIEERPGFEVDSVYKLLILSNPMKAPTARLKTTSQKRSHKSK